MKRKKNFFGKSYLILLALVFFQFFISFEALGQSIFTNPITGTSPGLTSPYTTGQIVDGNITVSGISRGSGISGNAGNDRYNASGWSTGAINMNDYFEFTITPNAGFKINFSDFTYTSQVSTPAPSHAFRSSIDGYTSNIGTPTTTGATINLSAGTYQNITTAITFRFYTFNIAAASTTFSINDFTFNGNVISTTTGTSDIIATPSFVFPTNIDYKLFQGATLTTANSIEVGQFTIRDGGASAPDADATATNLTSLTLSLSNFANIRRVALFDGSTNLSEVAGGATPTFASLTLSAPDNGTKVFSIRVSFNTAVTDNQQFQFAITNTTATGTGFAVVNAGGASTSIAGDNNRIEVTADRLIFTTQPINTTINNTMPPVVLQGIDINNNLDLDYTNTVSVTSTGTMNASPKTANGSAGIITFSNIFHTVAGTGLTLTATATGLISATSTTFSIITFVGTFLTPGDLVIVGFDAQETGSGTEDGVYLMNMVDLVPNTTFSYVNSRFEACAAANTRTMRWGGSGDQPYEDPGIVTLTWNGSSNIAKGSIIKMRLTATVASIIIEINGIINTSNFIISNPSTAFPNISSSSPDQLYVVQGNFTAYGTINVNRYNLFDGRVLFGFTNGATWVPFTSAVSCNDDGTGREGRLHPDLRCFNIENATLEDAMYYKTTGALHIGSKRALLIAIKNVTANWIKGVTSIPTARKTTTFTINTGKADGTWVGDIDTNWFDCANWEGLAVPGVNTDVIVETYTPNTNVADISATASFSDEFQDIAQCKNLTITDRSVRLESNRNNRLDVYGDINISATGSIDMNDGNNVVMDGTINLHGNFNANITNALDEGNGLINFVGSSEQTIQNAVFNENFYELNINKPAGDLKLLTTIKNDNRINFTQGKINLNAQNILLEDTGFLTENLPSNHLIYDATATNDYNKGGYIRITNRIINTTLTNLQGIGLFLGRTTGTDYQVQVLRRHYAGKMGVAIKRIYDVIVTSGVASSSNTNLRINYADSELNGNDKNQVKMYRYETTNGWFNYTTGFVNAPGSNLGAVTTVNGFSAWTLLQDNIALPSEFLTCKAILEKENQSLVSWRNNNQNAQYFNVQKSYNGVDFFTIAQVEGNKYEYLDILTQEKAYYRVLQFNAFGQMLESNIAEVNKQIDWVVYPNPSSENIYLKGFKNNENLKIMAFDAQGKLLFEENNTFENAQKSLQNNFSHWTKGIYLLKIQSQNQYKTFKVLKN